MRSLARTQFLGRALAWLLYVGAGFSATARADAEVEGAARALFEQGVSASGDELWLEARRCFKQSLALAPRASTYFNLAFVDVELGLGTEARDALERFAASATPSEHGNLIARAPALRERAEALERRNPADNAAALLLSDLELPTEASRQTAVALRAYANHEYRVALDAFERVHEKTGRPEFLYGIGLASDRLGDYPRALAAYDAFVLARPETPEAADVRARTQSWRGTAYPSRFVAAADPPSRTDGPQWVHPARRGRMLVGFSALAATAALGAGLWTDDRGDWLDYCDRHAATGRPCRASDERKTRAQYRAALTSTVVLSGAALSLAVSGAVRLLQSRRGAKQTLAWGALHQGGPGTWVSLDF